MDPGTTVGAILAAFGLSGAAGLNAWLPLFAGALLTRWGTVELAEPFDQLSTDTGLLVLGVLLAVDLVGDKVPAVDHLLHTAGTVVAPASGAILFTGQTGTETDVPTLVAVVLGATVAGSVHVERATARPASTAVTGGAGNPVLSLVEDLGSLVLVAAAFVVPVLAAILVVALLVGGFLLARTVTRRLRSGRAGP